MLSSNLILLLFISNSYYTSYGEFTNPRDYVDQRYYLNSIFVLGETQTLKWNTSLTDYQIYVWQQYADTAQPASDPVYSYLAANGRSDPMQSDWTVSDMGFDLSLSNVFYMYAGQDPEGFISHKFDVTDQPATTSTTSTTISDSATSTLILSNSLLIASATSSSSTSSTAATGPHCALRIWTTTGGKERDKLELGVSYGLIYNFDIA